MSRSSRPARGPRCPGRSGRPRCSSKPGRRAGSSSPGGTRCAPPRRRTPGRHVVLATGTASGKSLAFQLPALTAVLGGRRANGRRGATVLYLSPTKALAQDQLHAVSSLKVPGLAACTHDGDSPREQRDWARDHAEYLLTNPDMLHHSLLPGHARWARFLSQLQLRRGRRVPPLPRRLRGPRRPGAPPPAPGVRGVRRLADVRARLRDRRRAGGVSPAGSPDCPSRPSPTTLREGPGVAGAVGAAVHLPRGRERRTGTPGRHRRGGRPPRRPGGRRVSARWRSSGPARAPSRWRSPPGRCWTRWSRGCRARWRRTAAATCPRTAACSRQRSGEGRIVGHGGHQRPGARHRHRRPRRGAAGRLPRHPGRDVAAGRPGRAQRHRRAGRAGGARRPARHLPGEPSRGAGRARRWRRRSSTPATPTSSGRTCAPRPPRSR